MAKKSRKKTPEQKEELEKIKGMKRGSPEYNDYLRTIGDAILLINSKKEGSNLQNLSSTLIQRVLPWTFYQHWGMSPKKRERLHKDLVSIDSAYKEIQLSRGVSRKGDSISRLHIDEYNAIKEALTDFLPEGFSRNNLPKGSTDYVMEKIRDVSLRAIGKERTRNSLNILIKRVYAGKKEGISFVWGSPSNNMTIDDIAYEGFNAADLSTFGIPVLAKYAGLSDFQEERKRYLEHADPAHQALVSYLMQEETYLPLFGTGTQLVGAFAESDQSKIIKLSREDSDITEEQKSKIDIGTKCNLIFQTHDKKLILAGINQYVLGSPQNSSVSKVVTDAALLSHLVRLNNLESEKDGNSKYSNDVGVVLLAYEINPKTIADLRAIDNIWTETISKDSVGTYVNSLPLKHHPKL